MQLSQRIIRPVSVLVTFAVFFLGIQSSVLQAAMISTPSAVQAEQQAYTRDQIAEKLQAEEAQRILIGLGVDPADIESRVQAMTPAELQAFNAHAESMPAGSDTVVGILLFVFIMLVVLDLLGATNVFPVIRPLN